MSDQYFGADKKTLCVLVSFISVDSSMLLLSSADTLRGTSWSIQVHVLNSEIYIASYLKKDMCTVRDIMNVINKSKSQLSSHKSLYNSIVVGAQD